MPTTDKKYPALYSEESRRLFIIPTFYATGSGDIREFINVLQKADEILRSYGAEKTSCYEICDSSRYKRNWVFYANLDKCPKNIDPIQGMTMDSFIR